MKTQDSDFAPLGVVAVTDETGTFSLSLPAASDLNGLMVLVEAEGYATKIPSTPPRRST